MKIVDRYANEYQLPITFRLRQTTLSSPPPSQRIAGRDGSVKTSRRTLEPRTLELRGSVAGEAERNALATILQTGSVLLYDATERYIQAEIAEWEETPYLLGDYDIRLTLQARDPYWYGAEVGITKSINQFAVNWIFDVAGNAPTYPVLTIHANSQVDSPKMTHTQTGEFVEIAGIIPQGSQVKVYTDRALVTLNGVNALDRLTDAAALSTLALLPGSNNLLLSAFFSTAASFTLAYRPRWY